jgi:hypothetical protein
MTPDLAANADSPFAGRWAKRPIVPVFLMLAAVALARWLLSARVGLIPDEAYYWTWSLRPAWCYWDQPGGVAWIHAAWRALFGDSLVSLRALATAAALGASLAVWALVRRAAGERAALASVMILQVTPLFAAGAPLVLHDSILLPFAALAWLLWAIALLDDKPRWWLAVGLATAAASYAKFSAAVLGLGILLGTLADPVGRRQLRAPWPWLAGALVLVLFSPVVAWNAKHRWIACHAVARLAYDPDVAGWGRLLSVLDFIAGQFAVVTPVLAALGLWAAWLAARGRKALANRGRLLLAIPALTVVGYFLLNAGRAKIQANWAAAAWLGLLPLGVDWALSAGQRAKRALWVGVGLAIAVTIAAHLQLYARLAPLRPDITDQFFDWAGLAKRVQRAREQAGDRRMPVIARTYQTASELMRHLPDHPLIYTADFAHRGSQFTLWEDWGELAGRDAIFVDAGFMPNKLKRHFNSTTELRPYERWRRDRAVETDVLFVCRGFTLQGPEEAYMRDPVGHHLARMRAREARPAGDEPEGDAKLK